MKNEFMKDLTKKERQAQMEVDQVRRKLNQQFFHTSIVQLLDQDTTVVFCITSAMSLLTVLTQLHAFFNRYQSLACKLFLSSMITKLQGLLVQEGLKAIEVKIDCD